MLRILCLLTLIFTSLPALAGLPVVPQPQDMIFQGSPMDLKEAKEIAYSPLDNAQIKFSAAELQRAIKQRTGIDLPLKGINTNRLQVIIRTGKNPGSKVKVVRVYQPEEYMLDVSAGATADASDAQGVFYAVQTLIQLIESYGSKLPGCMITDSPVIKHRAVMIDMARLKEKHEYYYELIDYWPR